MNRYVKRVIIGWLTGMSLASLAEAFVFWQWNPDIVESMLIGAVLGCVGGYCGVAIATWIVD